MAHNTRPDSTRRTLRMRRTLVISAVLTVGLAWALEATAQPARAGVTITSPKDGVVWTAAGVIAGTAPGNKIVLKGNIGVPASWTTATFSFNGLTTATKPAWAIWTITPTTPGRFTFSVELDGDRNVNDLYFPFTARVTNTATGEYAQDVVTALDLRADPGLSAFRKNTRLTEGAALQMTGSGFDALEPTHRESLPDPTLIDFNTRLSGNVRGETRALALDTSFSKASKACFTLASAPSLEGTAAMTRMRVEAVAHYAAYTAAVAAGDTVLSKAECVRTAPFLGGGTQYEVCIEEIEGTAVGGSIAGVRGVDLRMGTGTTLDAEVTTEVVDTEIDGRFTKVFIRWAKKAPLCVLRPEVQVTLAELGVRGEWHDLVFCPRLVSKSPFATNINLRTAGSTPGKFRANPLAADTEQLDVSAQSLSKFDVAPQSEAIIPPDSLCALLPMMPHTQQLLANFGSAIEGAIETTWDETFPEGHQTRALERLLAPLEIGTTNTGLLDMRLNVMSSVFNGPAADRKAGLTLTFDSDAAWNFGLPDGNGWLFGQGIDALGLKILPNSRFRDPGQPAPSGEPFDLAYTLSTGVLNQMLRERKSTVLAANPRFTYADLGVTVAGTNPDDEADLSADVLTQFHPGFGSLGRSQLRFKLVTLFQPFVNIPKDPWVAPGAPPLPPGRLPLLYELDRLRLLVESDDPAMPLVLEYRFSFTDPELSLSFEGNGSPYLRLALSNGARSALTLVKSNLPGCKVLNLQGTSCLSTLSAKIADLVVPLLTERLIAMLSDIPAPRTFDAEGVASRAFAVESAETYQQDQLITLFGNLKMLGGSSQPMSLLMTPAQTFDDRNYFATSTALTKPSPIDPSTLM